MDLIRPIRRLVGVPGELARLRDTIEDLRRELVDERQRHDQERYAARHDSLTGLPNRLCLTEQAGVLLATSRPAVALIDLNKFKPVNDELGHAVGDAVLVELAARLTRLDRRWLVARLGGDEFAAVREGPVDEFDLVAEATALVEIVAAPMRVGRYELRVGCSIGLVIAYQPAELSMLLRCADAALYRSKSLGGRPVLWHPRRDDAAVPRAVDRPAVRTRDLRRARFGGVSMLVAADIDGGVDPAVGQARPVVSLAGAA
jgi:diguanylate cyclase (GGDEF)-like protein